MWTVATDTPIQASTSIPLFNLIQNTNQPYSLFNIDPLASSKNLYVKETSIDSNGRTVQTTIRQVSLNDNLAINDLYILSTLTDSNLKVLNVQLLNENTDQVILSEFINPSNFIGLVVTNSFLQQNDKLHIHVNSTILNQFLSISSALDKIKLLLNVAYVITVDKVLPNNTILLDLSSLNLSSITSVSIQGLQFYLDSTIPQTAKASTLRYTFNDNLLYLYNTSNTGAKFQDGVYIEGFTYDLNPYVKQTFTVNINQDSTTQDPSVFNVRSLTKGSVTYKKQQNFDTLISATNPNTGLLIFNKYSKLIWCI